MITGTHAIVYSQDPDAARTFFRDVLQLPFVDAYGGWLIFQLPPAELGIHPAGDPQPPAGRHELFLLCDDLEQTMAELAARGAEFAGPVSEQRWGLSTSLHVPGGGEIGLYQPLHATAFDLPAAGGAVDEPDGAHRGGTR